jgi:hypothetical protein
VIGRVIQEEVFVKFVESSFPSEKAYDQDVTAALQFEVERIFLCLDDMLEAAACQVCDQDCACNANVK